MSVFNDNTSPIPSFQRVLSACYHAEIDVQMQMIQATPTKAKVTGGTK